MKIKQWVLVIAAIIAGSGFRAQDDLPESVIRVATTMKYDTAKGIHGVAKFQIIGPLADSLRSWAGDSKGYFDSFVLARFVGWKLDALRLKNGDSWQQQLLFAADISNSSLVELNGNKAKIPASLGYQPYVTGQDYLFEGKYSEQLLFQTSYPESVNQLKMPQRKVRSGDMGNCRLTFSPSPGTRNFRSTIKLNRSTSAEGCVGFLSKHYVTMHSTYFEIVMAN